MMIADECTPALNMVTELTAKRCPQDSRVTVPPKSSSKELDASCPMEVKVVPRTELGSGVYKFSKGL